MQTASFDYTIRNAQGTIIGTATYANEALDAGAAEHERTGEVVSVHAPDGTEVACYGKRAVAPDPEEAIGTEVSAARSTASLAALHESLAPRPRREVALRLRTRAVGSPAGERRQPLRLPGRAAAGPGRPDPCRAPPLSPRGPPEARPRRGGVAVDVPSARRSVRVAEGE